MTPASHDMSPSADLQQQLISTIHYLAGRGWSPATGGNFSARVHRHEVLISASGKDKSEIDTNGLLTVNLHGDVLSAPADSKPSAETLLHTALYALDDTIGAVLHTHSVASTVLSRIIAADHWEISGYEMQKSLTGNTDHLASMRLWIVDNDQDMQILANRLNERWTESPLNWGLLVRGHGLYAWGKDLAEARRHVEGLEFLMACDLEMRKLNP